MNSKDFGEWLNRGNHNFKHGFRVKLPNRRIELYRGEDSYCLLCKYLDNNKIIRNINLRFTEDTMGAIVQMYLKLIVPEINSYFDCDEVKG